LKKMTLLVDFLTDWAGADTALRKMTLLVTADSQPESRPAARDSATPLPSFRAVYDEYLDFVWSCTRRLGVPMDAVADVVQEVFVVVHTRLETLRQPASLRSWVYGVVRRTVSTYRRRRRAKTGRESPESFGDQASDMQPSPLELAVMSDEIQLLWRLLGSLDARKREVFVMAELEELTMPEIAEAIGIPLNTAYSRLRAAREEFHEAFTRHSEEGRL
jgi:RNA polymerase sigma-70 factor (ECF subfamily)